MQPPPATLVAHELTMMSTLLPVLLIQFVCGPRPGKDVILGAPFVSGEAPTQWPLPSVQAKHIPSTPFVVPSMWKYAIDTLLAATFTFVNRLPVGCPLK